MELAIKRACSGGVNGTSVQGHRCFPQKIVSVGMVDESSFEILQ
jgi:hypothetical protein